MNQPRTSTTAKIQDLDDLTTVLSDLRASGRRIVHCHGVFDLLHIGHVRHFQSARQFGDVLVVTLTPDQWIKKGPHRPAFHEDLRAEMVANLQCVDYVAMNRWPTAIETIKLLKPHVFVKGSEYRDMSRDVTGAISLEGEAVRSVGGQLAFTDDAVFSSSTLINRYMPLLSREASEYLANFAARYSVADVVRYLEGASSLRVLVVGESIVDVYHYCQALGKSGKEPILAVRMDSSEQFAGGSLAVANHVAAFCDQVQLVSSLGQEDSHEAFIREKLDRHVEPTFVYVPGAPTILKRRFVEKYPFQKLFEVYHLQEPSTDSAVSAELCARLREVLPHFDLVIVADYGHAMIDPQVVQVLCRHARCLAINTQANAANHGFNTVSKYPRADYVCVSENEIRLEARQRRQDLEEIIETVATRMDCRKIMITRGQQGVLCYDRTQGFVQVPAFVGHFTDRVGAGDAVFAVTSLCMAQDAPADVLSVIGNAVGALAITVVGNRSAIDRTALVRTIISFFK